MLIQEIEMMVKSYIDQALNGLSKENIKFDFKQEWYNLKEPKDISEFLKDTSSIANTPGLDGIIVIGFNDKNLQYHDSTFTDSGLRDSNEIGNLITKNIDIAFNINTWDTVINDHSISIIHIPPSTTKPHVIRNYKKFDKDGSLKNEEVQRILIRRNTSVFPVSKTDLDAMYFDNRNIVPDYETYAIAIRPSSVFYFDSPSSIKFSTVLFIENLGRRALVVGKVELIFQIPDLVEISQLKFTATPTGSKRLIVKANSTEECQVELLLEDMQGTPVLADQLNKYKSNMREVILNLHLLNGKILAPIIG